MKRILFVDDDSKVLDGIRRMLHADRKQWEVQFAGGGEAALQLCESMEFDVVVSDMRMPIMDGAALLEQIKRHHPSTARIILSGHSTAEAALRAVPVAHRFLAKPCNAAELRTTIECVLNLQDLLCRPELRKIVGAVGRLPAMSSTYAALTHAIANPTSSIVEIVHIVEQDPAISAKVLQLVNSAFFGLRQNVTKLHDAVSYLGMNVIRSLVLVTDTFSAFKPHPDIPVTEFERIRDHAHKSAVIAARLPLKAGARDLAVIASLLQDVGILVLASKLPEQFLAVQALSQKQGCPTFEAEQQLLGTTHGEIGAYLLGLWAIPQLIVEAIAHHHHPARIPHLGFDISIATYVADLLARQQSTAGPLSEKPLSNSDRETLEALAILSQYAELTRIVDADAASHAREDPKSPKPPTTGN
jgi:HD-like signal output (HDOD) protein